MTIKLEFEKEIQDQTKTQNKETKDGSKLNLIAYKNEHKLDIMEIAEK